MHGQKGHSCGFAEISIFLAALVGGTACSITSKILLTMKGVGMTRETEDFSFPVFQTFGMFLGMLGALVLHFLVLKFRVPFPGYDHSSFDNPISSIPTWMYFMLIVPSIFDLVATCLCTFGLKHLSVSSYQMLRGSAIIFVAILKHFLLKTPLLKFKWVGVFWNVIAVVVVGLAAMMNDSPATTEAAPSTDPAHFTPNPLLGIFLILCGAFVQSLQYCFEEKVMSASAEEDIPAIPPLLLTGMEGFWGTVICLLVIYPVAYYLPGTDHGSFENPYNTWVMFVNSPDIQYIFTIYFFSILLYNILAVLVTYMLDSVWHAILDNFRPITVWAADLFIFYFITVTLGEQWTQWSYVQLLGMAVLLYGTAVYNAPNAGSIMLEGELASCYIDCTDEYEHLKALEKEAELKNTTTKGDIMFSPNRLPMQALSPSLTGRDQERRQMMRREQNRDSPFQQPAHGYGAMGNMGTAHYRDVQMPSRNSQV